MRHAPAALKWKDLATAGTPIPTPGTAQYGSVVGLFEGADIDQHVAEAERGRTVAVEVVWSGWAG